MTTRTRLLTWAAASAPAALPPSVAKAARKPAEDMAVIIEDLIKVLDKIGNDLRRGRYPEKARGAQYATLLRAVADDIEA